MTPRPNPDLADRLRTLLDTAALDDGPLGGLVPHRMPQPVRSQIGDPFFELASAEASGTVLRFATRAETVRLRVSVTAADVPGFPRPAPTVVVRSGAVEDVVPLIAGPIQFDPATFSFTSTPGEPQELILRPAPGEEVVTVLLPHNAVIEILDLESDAPILPAPDGRPIWLHYGSSISHCSEADTPASTWPMQVADRLDWRLRNLALSGQAQLDQPVARLIRDTAADLITLKIGINIVGAGSMRRRTFRSAVHGFLDTIRDGHPDAPIVVISAIACPEMEDAAGPGSVEAGRFIAPPAGSDPGPDALTLAASREILEEIVRERAVGDAALAYLDGRQLFGPADAHLLPDELHPNQAGMNVIATRFASLVPPLLARRTPPGHEAPRPA